MFDELRRKWREGREAWRGLRAFEALPREARRIVFYAETAADWAHLGPVAVAIERRGARAIRITSDRNDAVLVRDDAFFVGFGSALTVFFRTIDADAVVMTLTDLDQYHLKRSAHKQVHYFYVFHSIASTHRVYREHAFDAYDTILCAGPHHLAEVRRTEEVYGLPAKQLVEHGYGRLDTLIADLVSCQASFRECLAGGGEPSASPPLLDDVPHRHPRGDSHPAHRRQQSAHGNWLDTTLASKGAPPAGEGRRPNVLVAPSWGECSMVQHCLDAVIDILLGADFDVSLRIHPMTARHQPQLVETLLRRHRESGRFHFDPDVSTTDALLAADVMISEWSGAPLEYAFARERPVIFIDTPPKIHNPNHARVGLPALESDIREQIGRVIALSDLHTLPDAVRGLLAEADSWRDRIRAVRERTVFHVGRSGDVAAQHILGTLR